MKPSRRWTWIALAALAAAPLVCAPQGWVTNAPSASTRLFGPLLPVVAKVQWVRVDVAMRAGRPELALARAQSLFELDPRSGDPRLFVAMYLAFQLASPEREPDPTRRAAWLRAALEVLRDGEEAADDPGELALWQAELLVRAAESDPHIAWEGGVRELLRAAGEHYERAQQMGDSIAAKRLAALRERQGAQ